MQGLKAKVLIAMSALGMIMLIGGLLLLLHEQDDFVQTQSLRVAETVASQVIAEHFIYTTKVVQKLEQDGTGADQDAQNKLGYIHVPDQFLRYIAERTASSNQARYQYRLLSEWNYRPENGVVDDFEGWAWSQLKNQERTFKANGAEPDRQFGYAWQPAYRIEETPSGKTFRFMAALPASSSACTNCHNKLEQNPETLSFRQSQGNSAGKQWQVHDLMGALTVSIPLQELGQDAAQSKNWILAGWCLSLLLLIGAVTFIVSRAGTAPIKIAADTLANQSEQLEQNAQRLMSLNRDLALVTEQKYQSLEQLDFVKDLYSQDRGVQNLIESATAYLDKAKQLTEQSARAAEESAMVCTNIDKLSAEVQQVHRQMLAIVAHKNSK